MPRQILTSDQARAALLRGMDQVVDAVGATLGPKGQTVILARPGGLPLPPQVTKDGVTVAKDITLPDPFENEGAKLIQQVAGTTATEAGDGTTAATILTRAIFKEGNRLIAAGADPQGLERGIARATAFVVAHLKSLAVPVAAGQIGEVASIAANSDREIGDVIARAMEAVGVEGIITFGVSPTLETTLEIAEGVQFERGAIAPNAFITNQARGETVFEEPYIFMTDQRLIDMDAAGTLLETHVKRAGGRPLLIIAEDVEGGALQIMAVNNGGPIKVCPVKAPGGGEAKKEELEDIATLVGAEVFWNNMGRKLETATIEQFGQAARVVVTNGSPGRTTIIGGRGKKLLIETRKDQIRARMEDPATRDFVKAQLEQRLARLSAAVAVIKIGAATDAKLKEKRDRVEDSVYATRAAMLEGIVPGGGVALVRCIGPLQELVGTLSEDEAIGAKIVRHALEQPLRQLVKNAGGSPDVVVDMVRHYCERVPFHETANWGYNAASGEYQDLVAAGIIDPVKVVRLALQNSAEMAGLLLTSAALVVDLPVQRAEGREQGTGRPPLI